MREVDVAVVGGGMVGASFALALRTTRLRTSTASASTASVATIQTVAGIRPVSNAARLSAAKAATSPNGTKTTRVTEKISTSPRPASR